MKERPMLFSAPMIRAILAGTKTQTRRTVKPSKYVAMSSTAIRLSGDPAKLPCPYGNVGDRLWVREAFCDARQAAAGRVLYRASDDTACRWTPSIHMPRSASRITLEVTGVRVELLQAVSRGDAMAEGCPFANMATGPDPRQWYAELWDQINGAGAWDANPWVWAVSFKRVEV